MKDNEYISDFDESAKSDFPVNPDGPIDFYVAQRIEGNTGSTCEVYVAQYHHTKVLIKKLKPRLKNKILYKNALEKEFNLGFRLKHNSLPTYREFHDDYIIMEFIEGDTLLSLLQRKDPWLTKEVNVRKILTQLLDVVNYLHEKNVTHCDVKPDNIIITKGHHNVVLIDLDKTYTAYNPNTTGSTSHFDVEESKVGSPDMDFHGIGKLVDRILRTYRGLPEKKFRKFEKLCMGNNVQTDDLMEWLVNSNFHNGKSKRENGRNSELIGFGGMIACMIILAVVSLVLDFRDRENQRNEVPIISTPIPQKETPSTIVDDAEVSASHTESTIPKSGNQVIKDKDKDSYKSEIESEMATRILPLMTVIQEGYEVLANPNSTDNELRDVIFKLLNTESEIAQTAYSDFEVQYPSIEPLEVQIAVITSPSYKKASKEVDDLTKKITDEIIARNPESYSQEQ